MIEKEIITHCIQNAEPLTNGAENDTTYCVFFDNLYKQKQNTLTDNEYELWIKDAIKIINNLKSKLTQQYPNTYTVSNLINTAEFKEILQKKVTDAKMHPLNKYFPETTDSFIIFPKKPDVILIDSFLN